MEVPDAQWCLEKDDKATIGSSRTRPSTQRQQPQRGGGVGLGTDGQQGPGATAHPQSSEASAGQSHRQRYRGGTEPTEAGVGREPPEAQHTGAG